MRRITLFRLSLPVGAALIGLLSTASCGAGVAAVVADASDDGGTTVQPAIAAFTVENPKEPDQAMLSFSLSKPATVEFLYRLSGGSPLPMTQAGANPRALEIGAPPIRWNFALEQGLDASFHSDVLVYARIPGVQEEPSEGENALTLGLGNDPPVVEQASEPASPEVAGIVAVRLHVSDSSRDAVSIRAEFDVLGDEPDLGWQLARPGGLLPAEPTPDFAFTGVIAPPNDPDNGSNGIDLDFFWNTDVDLDDLERDARLRITAVDPVVESEPRETGTLHVDNNAAPIVQLDSGPIITNPDERRGIPVPFSVIDEEGDMVAALFQWRREGEEFPPLDIDGDEEVTNAEIEAIQADPFLRQERHVATPYPSFARGRVVPLDEDTVRLPELGGSEAWILATGLEGRTLELLRSSSIPAPITPTWRSNPLVSPIAALPIGDGLTALVLDVPASGRLREIELATGAVVRELAMLGPGIPSAMAFERGEEAVLVALDDAGTWRIEHVELANGAITELITSDGNEPPPVRGIASIGTHAAVFTAGSSLFRVDYHDPLAPRLARLLTGLASPWGVVVDSLSPGLLYLAERDANRVLAIELDAQGRLPVVVKTADMQLETLEAPEALALEHDGARLLIVTDAASGGPQLVGLDLGALGGNVSLPIGDPSSVGVQGLATGPDGLRLLSLPSSNEIRVAGGLEQRRSITADATTSRDVSVVPPFEPLPTPGRPWRIPEGARLRANVQGAPGRFVWNCADAQSGSVFLRAIGRDDEAGPTADGASEKRVRAALDVDPIALGGFGVTDGPQSIAAADMDGDGDRDLVSANQLGDSLTVFFQTSPGSFATTPLVVGGPGTTDSPVSVAAADLDEDGDQDLVSANSFGDNLTIFFQTTPGSFSATPLVLGGPGTTHFPGCVVATDLDGDGDQDLVAASTLGNSLTVFFQGSPGSFGAPLVVGDSGSTNLPISLAAADLDRDGDQDLVSANFGGRDLTVFFQGSPGSFGATPLVLGGTGTMNRPISVGTTDLDGDGDQDVISADQDDDDLKVFFQQSPGSFGTIPLVLGDSRTTDRPASVAMADLDGDGDRDLVSANRDGLAVFFQLSPGTFGATPLVVGDRGTRNFSNSSVAAADLDGDGDQDLVSANTSDFNLTVFLQQSAGRFGSPPLVLGGAGLPSSVAVADLDGDGDQDLVSASSGVTVLFQKSPGSFGAIPLVLGGSFPSSVAAADLDQDGDQDLVSANGHGNDLTVFFQQSRGSFGTIPLVLGGSGTTDLTSSVAVADLDGDGDQDLVSANETSENLTVFFQLAPAGFGTPLVLGGAETTRFPLAVVAADLDGDGDQDLVSANAGSSNLTVFFQLAPGGFGATPLVVGGSGTTDLPRSIAAADLDGDGDLDIGAACSDTSGLPIFLQQSPGSFGSTPQLVGFGTTTVPFSIAAADLDADGDQDLVSANNTGHDLGIFFQLGPLRFGAVPQVLGGFGTTNEPRWVTVADLDGDGDQDIVSANFGGGGLTVFFGGR